MIRNLIVFGLLFFINPIIFCQQPGYIRGKVIDSKTSQPVPFATVRLIKSQVGVLTNTEGDFVLLKSTRFQYDSLIISSIGFRRTTLAYSLLKTSGMNILELVPDIYSLNEVTVSAKRRRLSPEVIVFRALRDIEKNSPDKPFSFVSYYRDYQKDNTNNYFNLNEAIIQTLDKGFNFSSDSNRYRLLDFRKNTDFARTNLTPYYALPETDHSEESFKKIPHATLGDQYGNELFILLVHDAIRNFDKRSFSFVETFSKNFLSNHRFSDPVGIRDGNTLLYKIGFTSKRQVTGDSVRMKGVIYIQPDDYSIHKLEYTGSFLESENKYREIFNIDIEYDHEPAINSKMCLKYISFSNSFIIPDSSDNDFFRINKTEWRSAGGPYSDPFIDMTIISFFNRKIDPILGNRTDNYDLTIGAKKAKIKKVWVSGDKLYMTVRNDKFKSSELDSCSLNIRFLKDIEGNILNKKRSLEFRQFRELFVQEYNKPVEFQDNCFIQPGALEENCISISGNSGRFWMNTPLKSEENQKGPTASDVSNLDALVNMLNEKQVTLENVYIETDRNYYLAGDTIWFSAFVTDNLLIDSTSRSKILYADLINRNNELEKHLKLLISNGRAKGDFTVNKDAENGLYHLRAYTQYMRNFQSEFLFERDIPVYQSDFNRHILVNPVINKSIAGDSVDLYIRAILPAEYDSLEKKCEVFVRLNDTLSVKRTFSFTKVLNGSMGFFVPSALHCSSVEITTTLSENTIISTQKISLGLNSDIVLQFFPESGKLIDGIETVVAFKAADNAGNPKEFDADIVDENQNLITHISADRSGLGKFVITPERSNKYKALLTSTGNSLPGKYFFMLPETEPKGYILNFYPDSGKILIKNNQNPVKRRHYLLVSVRGEVNASYEIKTDTTTFELYLPFNTYPKGIVQITLYDSLFRPQAERLVFNNRNDKKMLIHVEADKKDYLNKEKVNLTINVKDVDGNPAESSLSLSVVDASKCDSLFSIPDIESYLYIASELKGKLNYSLLNLSDTTEEGNAKRDIVMMTQGWRNFLWNSIRYNDTLQYSYPIEKGLFIDGKVINYYNRRSLSDYTINFIDFNSGFNGVARPDENMKFEIESPLFYDSHDFFIQNRNKKNKRTVNVGIILDTIPVPDIINRNNELPWSSYKAGYLGAIDEKFTLADSILKTDIKYIILPEAKVTARKDRSGYSTPDVAIDLDKKDPTGKKYTSLFQMIQEEFGEKAFTATGFGTKGNTYNPILVVDGAPLTAALCPPCYDRDSYSWALSLPVTTISEIKLYEAQSRYSQWLTPPPPDPKVKSEGFWRWMVFPDSKIYLPVITLKTYPDSYRGYPTGAIFFEYEGLYNAREFYQPNHENNDNKIPDNRSTIYWNPEIKTDSTGTARISFFNSDLKGKAQIRVSGVSYSLKEASSSSSYYLSH